MSRNLQQQHDYWPASSEVYEGAFLRTVLRLHGIVGTPTDLQLAKARKVLRLYAIKVAMASFRGAAIDLDSLTGWLCQPTGVEHAFMFVRFDSVLPPDAGQVREFNEWLTGEDFHSAAGWRLQKPGAVVSGSPAAA